MTRRGILVALVPLFLYLALPGRVHAGEETSWSAALQTILESVPSLEEALAPLEEYLAGIADPHERAQALFEAARIYELSHRFSPAARWYRGALEEAPDFDEAALRYGGVLLELGEAREAVRVLSRMISSSGDRRIQRAGAILRGRAHFLAGETDTALAHAIALADQKHEAEALFLLFDIARALQDTDLLEQSRRDLSEYFGLSPEDRLASPRGGVRSVAAAPLPSRLLQEGGDRSGISGSIVRAPGPRDGGVPPLRDDSPSGEAPSGEVDPEEKEPAPATRDAESSSLTGIQTGSFRDRENASYMLRDITALGFSATIKTAETGSGRFYRVIVTLPEGYQPADAQETVVALKEEGIEGFLVFGP
ncbi:hypothetical protein AU468_01820 [Alkalispirochaeta sphaeroplastigenens]|uniref:SPOR domain-containing protein n=1 Tax=Alkalispirochaeta sphaeroplastigenens TaxID=1187066 RepID=A0A2S4K0F5_9SPIO|nr:hypothetical protein AU468_01820 [Alkalispirochaeta sphaeroplastigenens]